MLIDVLSTLLEVTDLRGAAVFLADASGRELTLRVSTGDFSDGDGQGIDVATRAIQSRHPVSHRLHPAPGSRTGEGDGGGIWMVSVPLLAKSRTVGALALTFPPGLPPAPGEVELFGAVGNQLGVALENALLYEELQQKEALRSELLRKVIAVQEEERRRIARELHDETSQALTALILSLKTASQAVPADKAGLVDKLHDLESVARGLLENVHRLIFDLRPSVLDDLGLVAAVRWYAENRLGPTGTRVYLETEGTERRLPSQIETAVFRVAQEALTNVARHAEAENAAISLSFEDTMLRVAIEDDGKGFDVAAVERSADSTRGLGLLGMRERVALLNGSLTIDSAPDSGTIVSVQVPVTAEREASDGHSSASGR